MDETGRPVKVPEIRRFQYRMSGTYVRGQLDSENSVALQRSASRKLDDDSLSTQLLVPC